MTAEDASPPQHSPLRVNLRALLDKLPGLFRQAFFKGFFLGEPLLGRVFADVP